MYEKKKHYFVSHIQLDLSHRYFSALYLSLFAEQKIEKMRTDSEIISCVFSRSGFIFQIKFPSYATCEVANQIRSYATKVNE